jgi:hypothetical protein
VSRVVGRPSRFDKRILFPDIPSRQKRRELRLLRIKTTNRKKPWTEAGLTVRPNVVATLQPRRCVSLVRVTERRRVNLS